VNQDATVLKQACSLAALGASDDLVHTYHNVDGGTPVKT